MIVEENLTINIGKLFTSPRYLLGTSNVHKRDLTYFDSIKFIGGSINSIYNKNLIFDKSEEDISLNEQGVFKIKKLMNI